MPPATPVALASALRPIPRSRPAHTAADKRCLLRRGDLLVRGGFTVKLLYTGEFWRACPCRLLDSGQRVILWRAARKEAAHHPAAGTRAVPRTLVCGQVPCPALL